MNNVCNKCGNEKVYYDGLCFECWKKEQKLNIYNKASEIKSPVGFKEWTAKDLSTAFFEAFGRYVKQSNEKDFSTISMVYNWAAHADHALSNTINYVFDWAKLDYATEWMKWHK